MFTRQTYFCKFYILICLFALFAFSGGKKVKFSGLIRYKITADYLDIRVDTAFVNAQYGQFLNYYYADGNFRKDFLNKKGELVRTELYLKEKNIFYPNLKPGRDTVDYYSPVYDNFEVFVVDESESPVDSVFGKLCYKTEFLIYDKSNTDFHLGYEYYTHPDLSISPADFSGFKDGGWYTVQKKLKALPYKWVRKNEKLKLTFEAMETKFVRPADSLFSIAANRPLKKIR